MSCTKNIFHFFILISTMTEDINAPDEDYFMKWFLARIFTRNFFVDLIGFNARGAKVQFKNTVLLRCFAGKFTAFIINNNFD